MISKLKIRGVLFEIPCHQELVVLCVKGRAKFPMAFKGIECSTCKGTCTAVLDSEPRWTHVDLPDFFPEVDDGKWQVSLTRLLNYEARHRWGGTTGQGS